MCETQNNINLRTLTRLDPLIVKIEDSAMACAVYKFCSSKGEWEKKEMEGSLFVVNRKGEPSHHIVVINRLNTTNMAEAITSKLEVKLDVPFLMYKNGKSDIFCIWFYDRDECIRLGTAIQRLSSGPATNLASDGGDINSKLAQLGLQQRNMGGENGTDRLFSLLQKGNTPVSTNGNENGNGGKGHNVNSARKGQDTSSISVNRGKEQGQPRACSTTQKGIQITIANNNSNNNSSDGKKKKNNNIFTNGQKSNAMPAAAPFGAPTTPITPVMNNGGGGGGPPSSATKGQRSVNLQELFAQASESNQQLPSMNQGHLREEAIVQNPSLPKLMSLGGPDDFVLTPEMLSKQAHAMDVRGAGTARSASRSNGDPPIIVGGQSATPVRLRPTPTPATNSVHQVHSFPNLEVFSASAVNNNNNNTNQGTMVKPLSMEQLKQTLISLLQNDADFLHTIHTAYLTSAFHV